MRGARPVKALEEVGGEGKFNTAPPPPFKRSTGTRVIEVAATAKRRAHKRTLQNWEPQKRCHCALPPDARPAKSPDFNIAENMFNMIQQELSRRGLTGVWPKNADQLEARILEAIKNIPKSWHRKSFRSLPQRWKKCLKLNVAITDFYVRKNA